jgi:selenocysteine-specific elongation factor
VDTDRLREEKERGITIELGFAHMGERATIIDVPGHERFIKTMVAGVNSIDLVLFVVAVDDGVMPQTREHLDILELLGVCDGIIVLTKADLVDEEWLELVTDDVRGLVKNTFLEGAPIHLTSTADGRGIDALRNEIETKLGAIGERRAGEIFRLPVDRAFVMRGFGTVVTGTVADGHLEVGERVEVLPQGVVARVRGLETHGHEVPRVGAGDRAALNLAGVEKAQVERGDVVAEPGAFLPSWRLDTELRLLASAPGPLGMRTRVRVHLGTREVLARVTLLEGEEVAPGGRAFAQLRLEGLAVGARGDRFVIRRYSPPLTTGGGAILDPHPVRHRARDARAVVEALRVLRTATPQEALIQHLRAARGSAKSLSHLAGALGLRAERVRTLVDALVAEGVAVTAGGAENPFVVEVEAVATVVRAVEALLSQHHARHRHQQGLSRAEVLRRVAGRLPEEVTEEALERAIGAGTVVAEGGILRLAEHMVRLTAEERVLAERLEAELGRHGLSPPRLDDLADALSVEKPKLLPLVEALVNLRRLVWLEKDMVLRAQEVAWAERTIRAAFGGGEELTVSTLREALGASRRFVVPLLNHFDSRGLTARRGDVRVLVDPGASSSVSWP